jgi:hypothetical protein
VSYPPVKAWHLLIDVAILASVIGKKLLLFCIAKCRLCGPSRHFAATQQFSRFRGEADIQLAALAEPDL